MEIGKKRRTKVSVFFIFAVFLLFTSPVSAQAYDQTKDPYTFSGKVGIGTNAPSTTLDVVGNGKITNTGGTGLFLSSSTTDIPQVANPLNATAYWLGGNNFDRGAVGGRYLLYINGSETQGDATIRNQDLVAQDSEIYYGRLDKTDTYTIDSAAALFTNHQRFNNNTRAMNLDNMYGLMSMAQGGIGTSGKIFATNFYHAYFDDFRYSSVWQADNLYGLYIKGNAGPAKSTTGIWVGKNTNATNNYGIVLAGDGLGADLVLGSNKETKLYGNTRNLIVDTSGKVGIGTTTPDSKLHVTGNAHVTGDLQVDGNIAAKYQDLAEYVRTSESLTMGMVVMIDTKEVNQVVPSDKAYNTLVAGVVSENPGIILGEGGEGKAVIAHTGRVKVKVDTNYGAISTGDLLVTSPVTGYAMKADTDKLKPGMLLGKALEPLIEGLQGEILALITLQ